METPARDLVLRLDVDAEDDNEGDEDGDADEAHHPSLPQITIGDDDGAIRLGLGRPRKATRI